MSKIRLLYHYLFTSIFYGPFFKAIGKKVIICSPILITPESLVIGSNVFIRNFGRIEGVKKYLDTFYTPIIEIKDGVTIEQNLHLTCANSITIGANTAIAANVTISDINHPYTDINCAPEHQQIEVANVVIGENCKIYNNAVILPGTNLGNHCVIGANSVVPGISYEDYSIVAGAPARVIKRYSFEEKKWLKTDPEGNFI